MTLATYKHLGSDFTTADIEYIESLGVPLNQITRQLEAFKAGSSQLDILRPCARDDGIHTLSESQMREYTDTFRKYQTRGDLIKFVPASGAATRMFRTLINLNNAYDQIDQRMLETDDPDKEKNLREFRTFIQDLHRFAFYEELQRTLDKMGLSLGNLLHKGEYKKILRAFLDPDGLNYANLPKALIPFHQYPGGSHTALEEHFRECMEYGSDLDGNCRLHITISPAHEDKIKRLVETLSRRYKRDGYIFHVDISFQKSHTDTLAADLNNQPFRDDQGQLIFRPGGHGSLLENLQATDSNLVFIKNIDNVTHESRRETTYQYKKALAGYLLTLQEKCFAYLTSLEPYVSGKARAPLDIYDELSAFCEKSLYIPEPRGDDKKAALHYYFSKLNRPLRVCGMVRNQGEPGGGPFWVKEKDNTPSLQIVESSQIDMEVESQYRAFSSAKYFNPVDIVCGLRDYQGKLFDLKRFVDPDTYFISIKSHQGKPLQAYEHPGLWNGSMADWNTVFVEVPVETFTPVKQVTDLLKPEHRQKND